MDGKERTCWMEGKIQIFDIVSLALHHLTHGLDGVLQVPFPSARPRDVPNTNPRLRVGNNRKHGLEKTIHGDVPVVIKPLGINAIKVKKEDS